VLVFPDDQAAGWAYLAAVDSSTVEEIRTWIRNGGVFVGLGGGAFFASAEGAGLSSVSRAEEAEEDLPEEEAEAAVRVVQPWPDRGEGADIAGTALFLAGDDSRFVSMMTDFVERHRNGAASTADFLAAANRAFGASAIALRFGLGNLNWFFAQWIQQTHLPSYRLEYAVEAADDGAYVVRGTLFQDDAPDNWQMVLPVVFEFDGDQVGRTVARVTGASSPFEVRLPSRPRRVALDPEHWVL